MCLNLWIGGTRIPFLIGTSSRTKLLKNINVLKKCRMFFSYLLSDPSGKLNFSGKAIIHAEGVDFSNGNSFKIKMNEFELKEELGKGQYGTVQKVFHKPTNVTMAMKVG